MNIIVRQQATYPSDPLDEGYVYYFLGCFLVCSADFALQFYPAYGISQWASIPILA